jgi:HSP20 family molecular chaperone IbpA
MKSLIDVNALRLTTRSAPADAIAPPHAMLETDRYYSIVLNLFGVERKDIAFGLNEKSREVTVVAKRARARVRTGFFWMFAVPEEVSLSGTEMLYQNGAVEIRIPKAAEVA